MDGGFLVLDSRDLSVVHEGRDSREFITDIKYNLDGTALACGSNDAKIYVYDVTNSYSLRGVFSQVRPGCRPSCCAAVVGTALCSCLVCGMFCVLLLLLVASLVSVMALCLSGGGELEGGIASQLWLVCLRRDG